MSDNQNRRNGEWEKYDQMSTEELKDFLRRDMEAHPEQVSDTEELLYVMGVLAHRLRENGQIPNTAQESYEAFKRNYLDVDLDEEDEPASKKALRPCWVRALSTVAAVLVVVLLLGTTVHAFAPDFWNAVATWTKETFCFGQQSPTDGPGDDSNMPYNSLEEALLANQIDTALAPSWIPDGYRLTDITHESTPRRNVYRARYENDDKCITITVRDYLNSSPQHVEQSEDFIEIYEVDGQEYYIFSNIERTQCVWLTGSYECQITGSLTIEELKLMIDSI